jgi:2-deoxy-D-gluconate 3-dehydrogenase
MDSFRLDGKVAIVTGANQGLGMAYALAFAKAGADLFIPHLTEDIAEIRDLIEKDGRKVHFFRGDLTGHGLSGQVIPECVRVYGKVDILVNNAGIGAFEKFDDFKDEVWRKVIEVNQNVCYFLAAAPRSR